MFISGLASTLPRMSTARQPTRQWSWTTMWVCLVSLTAERERKRVSILWDDNSSHILHTFQTAPNWIPLFCYHGQIMNYSGICNLLLPSLKLGVGVFVVNTAYILLTLWSHFLMGVFVMSTLKPSFVTCCSLYCPPFSWMTLQCSTEKCRDMSPLSSDPTSTTLSSGREGEKPISSHLEPHLLP